jgi:hypothetical protein
MNEDTDAPVTDIIFVKDMDECPEGYKMINHCPCGHDAQLWENVIGDKDQERYIAYTKDSTSEDVVEDLLITDGGFRYLKPGFVVMRRTLNGMQLSPTLCLCTVCILSHCYTAQLLSVCVCVCGRENFH